MKNVLLKTLCIGSSLSAATIPLVACSQQNTQTEFKTVVKSSFFNQMLELTINKQLKNKKLWKKFVDVFKDQEDTKVTDSNWRCEFWGKMMRGACITYAYSHDDELYDIITESIVDMLDRGQDNLGRFSTYEVNNEFTSWDLWGRKYVITAMLHYYEICKDNSLKDRIISALKKHADYIVAKIGDGAGKKSIVETGYSDWRSINSCTILEPMVSLYEITHEQKYLDFCTYIVNTGGIKHSADEKTMIECAQDPNLKPAEFTVVKAYETMSFFEGVYRYAQLIKNEQLKQTCISFFDRVIANEITVVGGSGCEEEKFNNSVEKQTITHGSEGSQGNFGQETCVTVTLMRILNILYEETGNLKYYEAFSKSALNAFLGTLNLYNQTTCKGFKGDPIQGIPFDSYSPLCNEPRGVCTGGLVEFKTQTDIPLYGCCVCIAPASVGLMGLNYSRHYDNKIYLNEYYPANIHANKTIIRVMGDYLSHGKAVISVNSSSDEELMLRIPEWAANNSEIKINGQAKEISKSSYCNAGVLKNIHTITIDFKPTVTKDVAGVGTNQKAYFKYGPYTLAVDQYNNPSFTDLSQINVKNIDASQLTQVDCALDEFVRFEVPYGDHGKVIFTNYAAAGRKSYFKSGDKCNLTVFFNKD